MVLKRLALTGLLFLLNQFCFGHSETSDFFRNSGKIYVVVAVMTVVLIGFFVFLAIIDRRVSRMEKEQNNSNP